MRKLKLFTEILITTLAYLVFPGWLAVVSAQSTQLDGSGLHFQTIRIPLFLPFDPQFAQSATIFTWITYIGILLTIGLVVFWIFLIIRTSVKALQSKGEAEGLQDAQKRFTSIFIGVFLTFLVPILLSVIGAFIGIGNVFNWPKMFSSCRNSGEYQYYFQAYLDNPSGINSDSYAEGQCGTAANPNITGQL